MRAILAPVPAAWIFCTGHRPSELALSASAGRQSTAGMKGSRGRRRAGITGESAGRERRMGLTWEVKSISVMDRKVRPKVLRTGPPATNYTAQWNLQSSPTFTLTVSLHIQESLGQCGLGTLLSFLKHSISIAVCTHQER